MVITSIRSLSRRFKYWDNRCQLLATRKTGFSDKLLKQGKQDLATHFLNKLQRIGESSGEHFCSRTTGISSGSV